VFLLSAHPKSINKILKEFGSVRSESDTPNGTVTNVENGTVLVGFSVFPGIYEFILIAEVLQG
jgi:hypothetical protein